MILRTWHEIGSAPKDGTDIMVQIHMVARAFWSEGEQRWVLSMPLHLEYPPDEPTVWSRLLGTAYGELARQEQKGSGNA